MEGLRRKADVTALKIVWGQCWAEELCGGLGGMNILGCRPLGLGSEIWGLNGFGAWAEGAKGKAY